MAHPRWRLTQPHYLNVPGTEWEYKEISQATGEEVRIRIPVHKFLSPKEPRFCNRDGDCVVTYGDPGPREYVFVGKPTPDMEPMNDEAQKLTDATAHEWKHPIETLANQGEGLQASWARDIAAILSSQKPSSPAGPVIDPNEFEELKKQVAVLMKRNAELEAMPAIVGTPAPAVTGRRA